MTPKHPPPSVHSIHPLPPSHLHPRSYHPQHATPRQPRSVCLSVCLQTDKQTNRQRQTGKQTNRQTNRQTKRQTDRQTNRQTNASGKKGGGGGGGGRRSQATSTYILGWGVDMYICGAGRDGRQEWMERE
ncbi:hypothetical protein IWX47DRAFT_862786, partial [Phyllosticta citricarpa]